MVNPADPDLRRRADDPGVAAQVALPGVATLSVETFTATELGRPMLHMEALLAFKGASQGEQADLLCCRGDRSVTGVSL